jgi:hypothetical protein
MPGLIAARRRFAITCVSIKLGIREMDSLFYAKNSIRGYQVHCGAGLPVPGVCVSACSLGDSIPNALVPQGIPVKLIAWKEKPVGRSSFTGSARSRSLAGHTINTETSFRAKQSFAGWCVPKPSFGTRPKRLSRNLINYLF